jgi:broad specificity phosphatase PhoE
MMRRFAIYFFLASALLSVTTAQSTVFVVRHAEKADATKDPDLSETGRTRAEALTKVLRDAKIAAIYVTEFKRTQETAAPLAKALGITVTVSPAQDSAALIAKLRASNGNALVVGHGDTIPNVMKALGISEPINIADNDYDNLFVVVLGEKPQLIRLHYR